MLQENSVITKESDIRKFSVRPLDTGAKICNVVSSFFCMSGLFLSLFFPTHTLCQTAVGRDVVLGNTILGLIVEYLQGSIALPPAQLFAILLYYTPLIIAAATVLSLLCTICSLLISRAAEKLFYWNVLVSILGYSFAALVATANSATQNNIIMIDVYLPLAAVLLTDGIFLLIHKRNLGSLGLYLLSFLTLLCLFIPNTTILAQIKLAFQSPFPLQNSICILLLCSISACNTLSATFRLNAGRGFLFEIIRNSAQCAVTLSYLITLIISAQSFSILKTQSKTIFFVVFLSVVSLLISVILHSVRRTIKQKTSIPTR